MELRKHLQLSEEDRKAYTESKIRAGILQLRLIFFLCGLLYALFGILDYLVVDLHLTTFLVIRFVIVIPLTLLYLAWTFHPSFIRMAKALTFILVVTGGVGIAFMLVVYPDNFSYYGGLFLVIFTGYFLAKQDTVPAVLSGMLTLLLYLLGYVVYHGFLSFEALLVVAFFVGANVIGAFGNHQLEQIGRSHFMQKREIERQNALLQNRVHEQQSELNQIEKAVDSTSDGVVICNPQGEITYCNQAYKTLMQPLALDSSRSTYHPFEDILASVLNGLTWEGERTFIKSDGETFVLLIQCDAVREEGSRIIGIVTICRDVSEQKQAVEKMAEQLHELKRWHEVMLDREDRVIELKREVNELLAQTGQQPQYQSIERHED